MATQNSLQLLLPNQKATEELGLFLGENLVKNQVILLRGEIGTGKTSLIQSLGRSLGIIEAISSPTFTLINEYYQGRLPLYHLDLYRLQGSHLGDLYPEIYWEGEEFEPGITAIEWSEILTTKPAKYIDIFLEYEETRGRKANLTFVDEPSLMSSLQHSSLFKKLNYYSAPN